MVGDAKGTRVAVGVSLGAKQRKELSDGESLGAVVVGRAVGKGVGESVVDSGVGIGVG